MQSDKKTSFFAALARVLLRGLAAAGRGWMRFIGRGFRLIGIHEPRLERAAVYAFTVHFLVIGLSAAPMLLEGFGCINPYRIPAGKPPQMQVVQVKVVRQKKLIVDPFSQVAFDWPKVEDAEKNLEQMTAQAKVGAGFGGSGMGGQGAGQIRFIRLEYRGDWDQGLKENAGANMLREFATRTSIPTKLEEEHHVIALLHKYPRDAMPPFVYMAGTRSFSLSRYDLKVLALYLDRGGMIIGDCTGQGGFDYSFRRAMSDAVPGGRWVTIPRDDEIFQKPYLLDGAPPLWHLGGYYALGIKYQGRWAVFYHPGAMGDAWKDGHGGIAPRKYEAAYEMGINLIFYAVEKYRAQLEQNK